MLKALELNGFKSFAAKTRFEFPKGITVVVGPNGSGKSNIVDAVKWVLGEQSVKSLRGKEMADVIFNGSSSRRGMNSAEVTLTFDNANGLLGVDTPEVHITRRVYRSGEGEYLINRQPCRLRDIRDLLSGTGMGTQAYSIIEQGKVDVLLQSSPKDRRAIFEEAAGISRFKAKKLESERRLGRVEQNLLRLSDIVDEVENRLRGVKSQAGKAKRFKEYRDRLQELRTQVGLVDWRRLTERLATFQAEIESLGDQRDASLAEAEATEAQLLLAETNVEEINEEIRRTEAHIAENRERIAADDSAIEHERARCVELEEEISRHRRQLAAMSGRVGDLQQQLRDTHERTATAETRHREIAKTFAEGERGLTELIAQLDQVRAENQQGRAALMEKMRAAAALGNDITRLESQLATGSARSETIEQRTRALDQQVEGVSRELGQLGQRRDDLNANVKQCDEALSTAKLRLGDRRADLSNRETELSQLQQRQSGLSERADVLEELQRRHEGLSPGVKEVLAEARGSIAGPFRHVRGLVADLFQVSVEAAILVEIALGDIAQHIVAEHSDELLNHIETHSRRLTGRVGFVWLDPRSATDTRLREIDLTGRSGVLGRADKFVETDVEHRGLAEMLLGRTWFVENLAVARSLAASDDGRMSFVTVAGELLRPDGTLIVGPRHAASGLISRRSELRALGEQLVALNTGIEEARNDVGRLHETIGHQEHQLIQLEGQHQQAQALLAEHVQTITAAGERKTQLARQIVGLKAELDGVNQQQNATKETLEGVRQEQRRTELAISESEARVARLAEQIDTLDAERQQRLRETTETKVELAKSEERLENLRARLRQFEESQQERQKAVGDSRRQLAECGSRLSQASRNILRAESEIAELHLHKESLSRETQASIAQRDELQQQRTSLTSTASRCRNKGRKLDEKIHAQQLASHEVEHERGALAERLREDYGTDLAELEHVPNDEEQHERQEVQQEIEGLRRKINNLGNINLEALEELDQLEDRYTTLSTQYNDLVSAKKSLEQIIERINVDSRRLFTETLETVTAHFAKLFRNLFGGGQAEIILEEGVDILESGIEIVARPPGKELRSISLLSGGEKTMTCVALLLAMFKSRPSPFCVLDEVDAALDEANIDRFTRVLDEFLAWTQFIIVTHSKKTMTCASTIYGVTMQESGVSKQVSVRFDDVTEDGHIRASAFTRAAENDDDDDEHQAA